MQGAHQLRDEWSLRRPSGGGRGLSDWYNSLEHVHEALSGSVIPRTYQRAEYGGFSVARVWTQGSCNAPGLYSRTQE